MAKVMVKPAAVIRKTVVERYTGINYAARLLDVTPTQVKRHLLGGRGYSMALARRMAERGVVVEAQ